MHGNDKLSPQDAILLFCVVLASVFMIILAVLANIVEIKILYISLVFIFVYLCLVFIFVSYRKNAKSIVDFATVDTLFNGELGEFISKIHSPIVLVSKNGSIIWSNEAFIKANRKVKAGKNIKDYSNLSIEAYPEGNGIFAAFGDLTYQAYKKHISANNEEYYFVVFEDTTKITYLQNKIENDKISVVIAAIDNYEEMSQYFQDSFTKIIADIDTQITEWADAMDGIIKPYGKDKFLIVCSVSKMREMGIKTNFSILDKVRGTFVGDYVPLTLSMGISCIGDTVSDVLKHAQGALETALQRGGDQAVLRSDSGTYFYGGKTKSVYKRSNVRATLIARMIASKISRSENVLIMAHRFGDFDSFAASVGMARYCMMCGVKPNIVVNRKDPNLSSCFELLEKSPEYKGLFIEGADGMEKIKKGTLLIVTDVNNFDNLEYPDIADNVSDLIIIDHHIKSSSLSVEPELTYIEPSASSASELVCEILQTRSTTYKLPKIEAELLLAGILLDTKNFTRNTGVRTFSAATFLRSEGADPIEANELFKDSVDDLTREAKFNSNIEIIEKTIPSTDGEEVKKLLAISYCEGNNDQSYRTSASKVADKLLELKDINAAFTIVKIENQVHVSARSDGTINVQLILEKLKGGGHFDVAGAQITGKTVAGAILMLKDAVNDYFESFAFHTEN